MNKINIPAKQLPDFIIIDDDPINNIVCLKIIQNILPEANVKTFTDPRSGLEHIRLLPDIAEFHKTILLLDINMPEMSGWEFMEELELLDNMKYMSIYILSSSVDEADKRRAELNENIIDYIVKPLDPSRIKDFIS